MWLRFGVGFVFLVGGFVVCSGGVGGVGLYCVSGFVGGVD